MDFYLSCLFDPGTFFFSFFFFFLPKLKSTQILDLIYKGFFCVFHEWQTFWKESIKKRKGAKAAWMGMRLRKEQRGRKGAVGEIRENASQLQHGHGHWATQETKGPDETRFSHSQYKCKLTWKRDRHTWTSCGCIMEEVVAEGGMVVYSGTPWELLNDSLDIFGTPLRALDGSRWGKMLWFVAPEVSFAVMYT